MVQTLKYEGKIVQLHTAMTNPQFTSKTVLASDPWDYVELWLKRNNKRDAVFFWQQSRHFFEASRALPFTSSPLTSYYCFLNAAKTLLKVKQIPFSDKHGVSGRSRANSRLSLTNEIVFLKTDGVLAAFRGHLDGGKVEEEKLVLKDILYNLPFIHRAYNLTFRSDPELFIPVRESRFVKKSGSSEAWFEFELEDKYASGHTLRRIPQRYERDLGVVDKFVIRMKKRFRYNGPNKLDNLLRYHRRVRQDLCYIAGPTKLWYVKRDNGARSIQKCSMTLIFSAMHRLSELSRYQPDTLSRHLDTTHNWLLTEFISSSPHQFIDEIASEITGESFMTPGIASGSIHR